MKNLDEYKKSYNYFNYDPKKSIYAYLEYDFMQIVEDYIIEYELYKKPFNNTFITNEIVKWILSWRTKNIEIAVPLDAFIFNCVLWFYEHNKELFIIGEE